MEANASPEPAPDVGSREPRSGTADPTRGTMHVDRCAEYEKGGDGGRGAATFWREKYVPKGGPDGGDGGDGGSVVVRVDPNADNLAGLTMKKHWKARNGEPGQGAKCAGKNAENVVLLV